MVGGRRKLRFSSTVWSIFQIIVIFYSTYRFEVLKKMFMYAQLA